MECIECEKEIDLFADTCPYCGARQYDAPPRKESLLWKKPQKPTKEPMFTEEDCFFMGIHPKDEKYRKIMELNILTKDYKNDR